MSSYTAITIVLVGSALADYCSYRLWLLDKQARLPPTVFAYLLLPLIVGSDFNWFKFVYVILGCVKIARLRELMSQSPLNLRADQESFLGFLVLLHVPTKVIPPSSDQARRGNRSKALNRALLGGAYLLGLAFLMLVKPLFLGSGWVFVLWQIAAAACLATGGMTMFESLLMTSGSYVPPGFISPLASPSFREFWGQRWNMAFSRIVKRDLFFPLKRKGLPTWFANGFVFTFSGAAHEYAVFVCLAYTDGSMGLFFLLHGLITFMDSWLTEKIDWLGDSLHRIPALSGLCESANLKRALRTVYFYGIMVATAPLFFRQLQYIVPIFQP